MKKKLIFLFLFISFFSNLYSENTSTTPMPYTDDEFPQWSKDVRRAEILSLGSLPFMTLVVTLGYSTYRYCKNDFSSEYVPNPLAKTSESANLDSDEQKIIIGTSILLSLGLGLTDLCYNVIKRNQLKKANELNNNLNAIKINPKENDNFQKEKKDLKTAYLYGGMKSVIF